MITLVSELRRRNVLRVAAAYALAAWIFIEAGSVLLPTFGASEGTFQTYVIVVLAGFVISIVFAWIFEVTPEGVKLDKDVDRAAPTDRRSRQTMNYALIGLLILALAVSITFNVTGIRDQDSAPLVSNTIKSIAVLPFASRSSNPDNIIFADGIHDDILTKLAKIAALKVISRTSVMEYRDTTKNVRQIGRELGVDTILSGTVQRVGDNVRIYMTLIDAESDSNLWADSFDRQFTMQSIFTLQSEISESVSGALRAKLTPAEQQRIATIPTRDLRAYNRYHEARENLSYRRRETLLDARALFEEAVLLDPDYAEAHAGLAENILLLMINHSAIPFDDAVELAQSELDRALSLDPDLADAHAVQGLLHTHVWTRTNRMGQDNIAAETSFRTAIALNPNHASAHMWFASLRDSEDRLDEAITLYQQAMDLDPLARIPFSNLPMIYAKQGHHREALELWVNAVDIHPEWPTVYEYIAMHLMGMGRLDEAFAWNHKATELTTDPFVGGNISVGIYYTFGEIEKAKALLNAFPDDHPMAGLVDGFHLLIDEDITAALRYFEQLIESGTVPAKYVYDIASDTALLANELDLARKFTLLKNPVLASDAELQVDRYTAGNVIRLAYIHKETGNEKRAFELLSATLPVVQELPRLGTFGHGIRDVQIFALLGRTEDALATLREAVDAGYRSALMQDNWPLEQDPYLKTIRDDPRFTVILNDIQQYVDIMRINLERAQSSGNWDSLTARATSTRI